MNVVQLTLSSAYCSRVSNYHRILYNQNEYFNRKAIQNQTVEKKVIHRVKSVTYELKFNLDSQGIAKATCRGGRRSSAADEQVKEEKEEEQSSTIFNDAG